MPRKLKRKYWALRNGQLCFSTHEGVLSWFFAGDIDVRATPILQHVEYTDGSICVGRFTWHTAERFPANMHKHVYAIYSPPFARTGCMRYCFDILQHHDKKTKT